MRQEDLGGWEDLIQDLAPVLAAITPFGRDLVVSGGVVPLLYRCLGQVSEVRQPALLTKDIDLTVSGPTSVRAGQALEDRLHQEEFVEIFSRTTEPPVIRYQHSRNGNQELAPIHVEFLTPQRGSARDRQGRDLSVRAIEPGIHAQVLPFLQLVFEEPIEVTSDQVDWLRPGTRVYLPHPATYLLVKLLVINRRTDPAKRAKDAAYVYDVVTLMSNDWSSVAEFWRRLRDDRRCPASWITKAEATLLKLFAAADADGPVWVNRTYADPMGATAAPSETAVVRVMTGFRAVLRAALDGA